MKQTHCPLLFGPICDATTVPRRNNGRVNCACCSALCVSASPAMRGSTPLDVAASSVMDNNGLALALEEPDLDKVRLMGTLYCVESGWSDEKWRRD